MSEAFQLGVPGTENHVDNGVELRQTRDGLQCRRGRTDWMDVEIGDWLKVDVADEVSRIPEPPEDRKRKVR